MNKDTELIIQFLSTLFYSWGSDSPAEAFWAGNEFLDYYNNKYNTKLVNFFDEENHESIDKVIEEITNLNN